MSEHEAPASERPEGGSERDELRTMSFRMREIQRLLAARVEQENRRLEAEGLEPVDESRFVRHEEQSD
jgi:hypothetical protein